MLRATPAARASAMRALAAAKRASSRRRVRAQRGLCVDHSMCRRRAREPFARLRDLLLGEVQPFGSTLNCSVPLERSSKRRAHPAATWSRQVLRAHLRLAHQRIPVRCSLPSR